MVMCVCVVLPPAHTECCTCVCVCRLDHFVDFHPSEHPLTAQLGGSQPSSLAHAARMLQDFGYSEINLNCGCPSERVSTKGCFGAKLMQDAQRVAAIVTSIKDSGVTLPVTVKCRLGADEMESYEEVSFWRLLSPLSCTLTRSPSLSLTLPAASCATSSPQWRRLVWTPSSCTRASVGRPDCPLTITG